VKKTIVSFLLGGIAGAVAGFAFGIFIYPYIFLADIVAVEKLEDAASRRLLAEGQFIHANPSDPIHYGSGAVKVYQDAVHLQEDFKVGPGPAYHVYLVPEQMVATDTKVAQTMFVDLGRLRAFQGSQVYAVPAGVDPAKYPNVVVWCEHFGVLISPAKLQFK